MLEQSLARYVNWLRLGELFGIEQIFPTDLRDREHVVCVGHEPIILGERTTAMPENDVTYYSRRAEFERARARDATLPKVAAAHHRLASAYLQRVVTAKADRGTGHG